SSNHPFFWRFVMSRFCVAGIRRFKTLFLDWRTTMYESLHRRAAKHAQRRPRSCRLELQGLEQRIVPSWVFDQPVQGAPAALSAPCGCGAPDGAGRGVRTDPIVKIGDLILPPGGTWQAEQFSGIPAAASAPFAYVTPDGTARVVYKDTAGNIDDLFLPPGGTW